MNKILATCFVLALPVAAAGCVIVTNPQPKNAQLAATTAGPAATPTAQPQPTAEEPKKVAVPKIFGGGNKQDEGTGGAGGESTEGGTQ